MGRSHRDVAMVLLNCIRPGADSDELVVRYSVAAERGEHIALDGGYTYDERTGAVRGPAGRPALQNRPAVTEDGAMLASWSRIAAVPHRWRPQFMSSLDPGRTHPSERARTALRRFPRRR